ncbi:MAG: molybdopterin converting factor subunit 1 [Aridibacter famidurans]|nr:molybdopterin converting factor subunit 1 [Aridibacter famidurans]
MHVKVLFFGATADETGTTESTIELPEGTRADAALTEILDRYPKLTASRDRSSLLFAVNQEYARADEAVNEGDELAVFTAVSGG